MLFCRPRALPRLLRKLDLVDPVTSPVPPRRLHLHFSKASRWIAGTALQRRAPCTTPPLRDLGRLRLQRSLPLMCVLPTPLRVSDLRRSNLLLPSRNGAYASPSKLKAPTATEKPSGTVSGPRAEKTTGYVLPQIALQTASPQRNERPSADLQRRNTSPTKSNVAATSAPPSARVALANLYDAPDHHTQPLRRLRRLRRRRLSTLPAHVPTEGSASEMMPTSASSGRASSRPVSPIKSTFGATAALPPQAAPQPVPQRHRRLARTPPSPRDPSRCRRWATRRCRSSSKRLPTSLRRFVPQVTSPMRFNPSSSSSRTR